jgi:amino acid transporter
MIFWIIVGLLVLLLLVFIGALALRKDKKLPPTDYYTFFVIGIVWLIFGIPMMITSDSPTFFILGLVFTAIGLLHKNEWKKGREANKWENLSKDQKRMKQIFLWTLLGLIILGLLVFALTYFLAL